MDSYNFNNKIRDVSSAFTTLISQSPSFLSLLGSFEQSLNSLGTPVVTNTKYEWVNKALAPTSSKILSFVSNGDGNGILLESAAGFEVGSQIRFERADGTSVEERVKITAINNNVVTVVRRYGDTPAATLEVNDIAHLISTPRKEGSLVGKAITSQGTIDYNYTEIFDEVAELNKTAQAIRTYDRSTELSIQVEDAMIRLARKIENACIHGVRVQRVPEQESGSLGGVLQFLQRDGGNIFDAGSNSITQRTINDALEAIMSKGGLLRNPIIMGPLNQMRAINALNQAQNGPLVVKNYDDRKIGQYTTTFVGDLVRNDGSGVNYRLFHATSMPKDKIVILDMDSISVKVMRPLEGSNASLPGEDGTRERLLTELTLEVRNASDAHAIITGLNPTVQP